MFEMIRPLVHMLLHAAVPAAAARWFFPGKWRRAWGIMMLAMLIDLDHLPADPIYDPGRCSIGFHPLHTPVAVAVYAAMLLFPRTRIAGLGLVLHIALDAVDCLMMKSCFFY